ncbi:MAG: HAMP domain-containing protein [Firmicutes bacterium]|nr:HAMP domain-containing protein [Bacillota bacterium]
MFKSIQWKMVIIYFLLILLAMQVISVYLLRSLEQYHLNSLSSFLNKQAQLISGFLERYLKEPYDNEHISDLLRELGFEIKEIYVLDPTGSVISTSSPDISRIGKRMLSNEITKAMVGEVGEDIRLDPTTNERLKYMAFPVESGGKVVGILYMVASLEKIYETLRDIKEILLGATILALVITGFLGFALARTITGPIQEVTSKAASLARGDFDQKIEVKSSDEIGQLTEMFNYLTLRLKDTLGEISNEKSKVEAILTYMADGVVAINNTGEIIHINPRAMEMLGVSSEAIGKKFTQVFSEEFKGITLKELFEKNSEHGREIVLELKSSVLRAHFAYFKNEKGNITGVVIVIRDVTEEEKLERMRKEFVANVSHEIKTPITTIKSYAETLMEGALSDREISQRFLSVIIKEADRMSRLVSDLLQLSRLDYQKTRWVKEPISLVKIVEDVITKLVVTIKQKNMEVYQTFEDGFPMILGDRDRIEQVILNVIGNAVKYTPEGGRIEIKGSSENRRVVLNISDNGIGIPEEDLPRVFERFYRVDKARTRDLGGTGLGLSIAKQIIEAHDGTIVIDSRYGEGTTVTITLPAYL